MEERSYALISTVQNCRFILRPLHKQKKFSRQERTKWEKKQCIPRFSKIEVKYQGWKIPRWRKFLRQILPSCSRYLFPVEDLPLIKCQLAGSEICRYAKWSILPSSSKGTWFCLSSLQDVVYWYGSFPIHNQPWLWNLQKLQGIVC